MSPRFVSLFSGCGGLDLGFIQAGFTCIAAFDLDKDAVDTYRRNIGDHIQRKDLGSFVIDPSVVKKIKEADVLVAGPPCQGFSTAGKNDPSDIRNSLLIRVAELAAEALPKVVVIENVRGLLSPRYEAYWSRLISILNDAGYHVSSKVIEASSVGVAQRRKRVIVIATHKTPAIDLLFRHIPEKTLGQALIGVESFSHHNVVPLLPESDVFKIAMHIAQGQKLSNVRGGESSVHTWEIPEVFGRTTLKEKKILEALLQMRRKNRRRSIGDADPVELDLICDALGFDVYPHIEKLISKGYIRRVGELYDITHTFNGKYRRLKAHEPAPTVDTRFGEARYFLHPYENRGFSVREAARIQGFPDSFFFEVSSKSAYRLIGNAVPPPMAKAIASLIKKKVFDKDASTILREACFVD